MEHIENFQKLLKKEEENLM